MRLAARLAPVAATPVGPTTAMDSATAAVETAMESAAGKVSWTAKPVPHKAGMTKPGVAKSTPRTKAKSE